MTRGRQETGLAPGPSPGRRPGWLLEAVGDDRPRGMAVTRESQGSRHTEPGLQADWRNFLVLRFLLILY